MAEIVSLGKPPEETNLFSKTGLDPITIYQGCMKIRGWLHAQIDRYYSEPSELNPSSRLDRSCIRLLETAAFLRGLVVIKNDRLTFSEELSETQIDEILRWIKENDRLDAIFTYKT